MFKCLNSIKKVKEFSRKVRVASQSIDDPDFVVDHGCAYKILASGKLIKINLSILIIISARPLTIYT